MKTLLYFLVLIGSHAWAQPPANFTQHLKEIALAEGLNHSRLETTGTLTGASTNFDVKYYRCEWQVDPAIRYINGKVTIYFVIAAAGDAITLDLMSPLNVDSVKQRSTLINALHNDNTLQISFPTSITAGTLDSISIYYQGVPPNTGFGSFVLSQHAGTPVMWSLSEPYGARDWWPCKNGLDDKADSIDIIVTTPVQYKAASNGLLQSENIIEGGTKKVAHWKHRYPIATYLMCFAVTNYTVFNNVVQLGNISLPVQTYCYPESVASFQAGTQKVLNAMQYFNTKFGEYPFIKEKYGHVQFSWGGGMEHQTASFVVSIVEYLTVHELAHQWFGDMITCGTWQDIWLNEGFATQLTALYYENFFPSYTQSIRKDHIDGITSVPGGSVKVDDTTNVSRIFSSRLSYSKGCYLLYMLRWKLGDSTFFKALNNYLVDPKLNHGFAKTADLKKHLEDESKQDLTQFFKDWYEGQGYPTYNVQWTPIGKEYTKIKINQTTSHPSVSFFAMPLALKLKNSTQQKTIVLNNKINGELFLEKIGFVPDSVFVDPEYWILSKNNTATKVNENTGKQNVVTVYPNPIKSPFYIYLQNFTAPTVTIKLFNAAGQLLYNKTVALTNGSEYLEIPSANLPKGIYMLQIIASDGFKYNKKLLK